MKYRIKLASSDVRPYRVQRMNEKARFSFWKFVDAFTRQHEAEAFIKRAAERHGQHPIGSVIFEYDESDAVVDRLKNQKGYDVSEGVTMAADSAVGMARQNVARVR
jgi:hypothetical protein